LCLFQINWLTFEQYSSPNDAPFVSTNEDRLYTSTHNALANITSRLKAPNATYPILRVFASYPGDASLGRLLTFNDPTQQKRAAEKTSGQKEAEQANVPDPDLHPLAALHATNFEASGKTLSQKWFSGDIEQKEVVYPQHPPVQVERLRRSERIRNLAHKGLQDLAETK
jgi:hypothetical protein